MKSSTNILELPGVIQTEKFKTLVINKKSQSYPVYQVPLKYLFYNDQNDRISTEIVRYTSENHTKIPEDREEYNALFERFIVESKEDAIVRTQKSIKNRGQDNAGVVLIDGRVIDGNRRFTCLRRIARETNIEQFFLTVILDMDYTNHYKYIKSLELELQMGVEGPVQYDPIDRLFGIYKSIRLEKAFSVEEYAALFDDRSASDISSDLELADLMCEFLDFINCSNKFYIAKDMKLDGVLHEIPGVLNKVKKKSPEHVEDFKNLIFSYIEMGVDSRINVFIRDLKKVVDDGDYLALLENTDKQVQAVQQLNDEVSIESMTDISDKIRSNSEIKENLIEVTKSEKRTVDSKKLLKAPLRIANDALYQIERIQPSSVVAMSIEDQKKFKDTLLQIQEKIKVLGVNNES